MPKMKGSKPDPDELPATIKRSPAKAQRIFAKTHDSAAEQYGDDERAHRVAYSALKHSFEKVGDHWEPKENPGPSDPRAASPRAAAGEGETYGGVDGVGNTRRQLLERAGKLDIRGRWKMNKGELAKAIGRRQ